MFGDVPDAYTWLGAALIVGSGLIIAWREGIARQRAPARRVNGTGSAIAVSATGWFLIALAVAAFLARR